MNRVGNSLAALCLVATAATGATTPPRDLGADLVGSERERWVHEQRVRCDFPMRGAITRGVVVHRRIDAPQNLVSRDNFVYVGTRLLFSNRVFLALMLEPGTSIADALGAIRCSPVEANTPADFRIELRMHEGGVRVKTTDVGRGHSVVDDLSWPDVLGVDADR